MAYRRFLILFSTLCMFFTAASPATDNVPGWPRQLSSGKETLTLTQPPQRIVSTSITLTGSLLAIDAPLVASGAAMPGKRFTDGQGFFRQWGDIARQRGVRKLYSGEPSLETIAAARPDLIIVSATGNDSALALYPQLKAIAPTLIVNYDDKSWQQVMRELGQATGQEAQAQQRIADFDRRLQQLRQRLVLPPQPVSAFVYNRSGPQINLWTPASAQGQLLQQLGFTLAPLPARYTPPAVQKRRDKVPLSGEALVNGLAGQSFLLFAAGDTDAATLKREPLLAAAPAVQQQRVWAMGEESFRLDYYSAGQLLIRIGALFSTARTTNAEDHR
ncbi:Fe2+-enterobactin ABC transporter substrate-binding protein [Mixta gaviniae]|uniref:Fe2+-enterobactin ABC transporter substrate-binding protein n=1 Tax=Mixta gaviniae TaxID=665914 RepID=A0A2L0ICK8_9GAMM|nr:Fe2+-enterobactin ABC transporter substrate-binding protein [Mixta gaviniae]